MKRYQIIDKQTGEVVEETEWDENDLESLKVEIELGRSITAILSPKVEICEFEIKEVEQ